MAPSLIERRPRAAPMAVFRLQLTRQSAVRRSTFNPSGVIVAAETAEGGFPTATKSISVQGAGETGGGATSPAVSRARLDFSACLRASKTTLNMFSQGRFVGS